MKRYFREWSVFVAFLAILLLLAFRAPEFFKPAQLLSMLCDAVPVLIAACGMTLVIICRQIDISIGSQFALCSVFAGLAASNGWPMPLVGIVAILCGAIMGAFNGALVAFLGIPSIVVTLATMVTWREALRWWREGEFVSNLPDTFQWFGLSQQAGQFTIIAIAVLLFLFLAFALKHISAGRFVYAVGSDKEAARLAGIHPQKVTFAVFVLMGALTGLAALLNAVRFPDVDPKAGQGLELKAIAAAVVGWSGHLRRAGISLGRRSRRSSSFLHCPCPGFPASAAPMGEGIARLDHPPRRRRGRLALGAQETLIARIIR